MRQRPTGRAIAALTAAAVLVLSACSGDDGDEPEVGQTSAAAAGATTTAAAAGSAAPAPAAAAGAKTVNYWLWDANQQPGYEKCAAAFTKENPDIAVKFTQYGWDDYWTTLTTGLVSGEGPDVFTGHLSHYPQFAAKGQLLPIDDLVESKQADLSIYRPGLADLWVAQDGKRYGLPKDWDTVAIFANQDMLTKAGVTQEQLAQAEWNPADGGSYEKIIAHLTVDKKGVRGDEAGFDKKNIATYGLGLNGSGGGFGQTEWSHYAFSNGWQHSDKNPWGTKWNYDDPKFLETIKWFRSLAEKGYMPTQQIADSGIGQMDAYGAGKYAMVTEGSWNTKSYFGLEGVKSMIAPLPKGPNGQRASMFNGLADNIPANTKRPDEAKKLVAFLGSKACQDIIAAEGNVFPAVEASGEIATKAFKDKGIDVSAFQVPVNEKSTYLAPVAENWAELQAIMTPAMDGIMGLSADVDTLKTANKQVNSLFK